MKATFQPALSTTPKRPAATQPTVLGKTALGRAKPDTVTLRFGQTQAEAERLFREAAMKGDKYTLLGFIKAGKVDINIADEKGHTAAILAAAMGKTETLQPLIEAGVNLDHQDKQGMTATMHAVRDAHRDALAMLIHAKANLDLQNIDGTTALMHAVKSRSLHNLRVLLKANANANLQDANGDTPATMAVRLGCLAALKMLIDAGADLDILDKKGKTVAIIAEEKGYTDVVNRIQEGVVPEGLDDQEMAAFLKAYTLPIDS